MSDYWLEFKQQGMAHKALPVRLFPLKVTKTSPPLPSHDASGTTSLSRKSRKKKVMVKESMQGKESMRDREKVFYFCFEPKQLKKTQRPEHYNHDGPRTDLFEKISHNGNCWLIIWGFFFPSLSLPIFHVHGLHQMDPRWKN